MTLNTVSWRGAQVPLLSGEVSRSGVDQYIQMIMNAQGYMGPPAPVTLYGNRPAEQISNSFEGFVCGMLYQDGPVASVEQYRIGVFGQAPLLYQDIADGRPGDFFDDDRLDRLREPWPGGSLSDLAKRGLVYGDFAGNAFVVDLEDELVLLRPDWVEIVLEKRIYRGVHVGWKQVGIMYYEGGLFNGDGAPFLPGEYAHFVPGLPDPLATYRGMSWLTPLVREVKADKAAGDHKVAWFENAASVNVAVSLPKEITAEQFNLFVDRMDSQHRGAHNAGKTLYTGGGADVTVIGANMQQADFASIVGKGENRVANAGRVPAVLLGFSEGLGGSSLNAGNYTAAKRNFVDTTCRDLWQNWAQSLQQMDAFKPPKPKARLWYDGRDIPFLHEDAQDLAGIQQQRAGTVNTYVTAGFTPDSAVQAVAHDDITLLEHTGLTSVQLLPPGSPGEPTVPGGPTPDGAPGGPATPYGDGGAPGTPYGDEPDDEFEPDADREVPYLGEPGLARSDLFGRSEVFRTRHDVSHQARVDAGDKYGGRFGSVLGGRLKDWLAGGGKGNPNSLFEGQSRATIVAAAKRQGVTVPARMSLPAIQSALLAKIQQDGHVVESKSDVPTPKPSAKVEPHPDHRQFALTVKGQKVQAAIWRNVDTGKLSVYESRDGQKTGRALGSAPDIAALGVWARKQGHDDLADYADTQAVTPRAGAGSADDVPDLDLLEEIANGSKAATAENFPLAKLQDLDRRRLLHLEPGGVYIVTVGGLQALDEAGRPHPRTGALPATKAAPAKKAPARKAAPKKTAARDRSKGGGAAAAIPVHVEVSQAAYDADPATWSPAQHYAMDPQNFRDVNGCLRGGVCSTRSRELIGGIDDQLADSRVTSDIVVYRGASNGRRIFGDAWDSGDMAGTEFGDGAYMSASTERNIAQVYSHGNAGGFDNDAGGSVVMEVRVPRGTRALYLDGPLAEVLIDRRNRARVVEDHGRDAQGRRRLVVEVLPAVVGEDDGPDIAPSRGAPGSTRDTRALSPAGERGLLRVLPEDERGRDGGGSYRNPDGTAGPWGQYGAAGLLVSHVGPDGQRRYLLARRGLGVENGGVWAFPGGAIDEHESDYQGATRELAEELGINPAELAEAGVHGTHTFTTPGGWHYTSVAATVPTQITPRSSEHSWETSETKWMTAEEIADLDRQGLLHDALAGGKLQQNVLSLFPEPASRKAAKVAIPATADGPSPGVKAARDRQARIDAVKPVADLLAEYDGLRSDEAEPDVIEQRLRQSARRQGVDESVVDDILAGDGDTLARQHGLTRVSGPAGAVEPYDPKVHKAIGGGVKQGQMVHVIKPVYSYDPGDGDVNLGRADVEEATPDEIAKAKPAKAAPAKKANPKPTKATLSDLRSTSSRDEAEALLSSSKHSKAELVAMVTESGQKPSAKATVSTLKSMLLDEVHGDRPADDLDDYVTFGLANLAREHGLDVSEHVTEADRPEILAKLRAAGITQYPQDEPPAPVGEFITPRHIEQLRRLRDDKFTQRLAGQTGASRQRNQRLDDLVRDGLARRERDNYFITDAGRARLVHGDTSPSVDVPSSDFDPASPAEVAKIINSTLTDDGKRAILTNLGVPQSDWPESLRPPPTVTPPTPTDAERLAAGYPDVPDGVEVDEDAWSAMSYGERLQALIGARQANPNPVPEALPLPNPDGLDTMDEPALRKWARGEAGLSGVDGKSVDEIKAELRAQGIGSPEREHAKSLAALEAEQAATPTFTDAEVEADIRQAYSDLVGRVGEWASLTEVRRRVRSADREQVDRVLTQMGRESGTRLTPENAQKRLTDEDWAAAVRTGNSDKHLLSITQNVPPRSPRPKGPGPTFTDAEVEADIRRAVAELAPSGGWVSLADLRSRIQSTDPDQVDRVLTAMNRQPGVRLVPESNQKAMRDIHHDAAIVIGNQYKHLIKIDPTPGEAGPEAEPAAKATEAEVEQAVRDAYARALAHKRSLPVQRVELLNGTYHTIREPSPLGLTAADSATSRVVDFADLRAQLDNRYSRDEVDAAIRRLHQHHPDVHILPENTQRALRPEAREAAVSIGNQDKHNIAIDETPDELTPRDFSAIEMEEELNARRTGGARNPRMSALSDAALRAEVSARIGRDPVVRRDIEAFRRRVGDVGTQSSDADGG